MEESVRAEMTGNVIRVLVGIGDSVRDGDTLLILESMKMEIPVISPTSGVIRDLDVSEGDTVHEGDVIVIIA